MASERFYLPSPTAFSSNGFAVPGALASFYLTGTATRTPIYTTAALDVEHSNPVVADAAGRFPVIFLDDAVTYRLVITDSAGSSIGVDDDPYVAPASPSEIAAGVAAAEEARLLAVVAALNYIATNAGGTTDGLANTVDGEKFGVISASGSTIAIYRNDSGVATDLGFSFVSGTAALAAETNAATSEANAATSETNAAESAAIAAGAVAGSGLESREDFPSSDGGTLTLSTASTVTAITSVYINGLLAPLSKYTTNPASKQVTFNDTVFGLPTISVLYLTA